MAVLQFTVFRCSSIGLIWKAKQCLLCPFYGLIVMFACYMHKCVRDL